MPDLTLPVTVTTEPPPTTAQASASAAATTAASKPGWKTTELYFQIAAWILSGLFASGAITNSAWLATMGAVASFLGAMGYTVSRTMIKRVALVMPVLLLATQPACAATTRTDSLAVATAGANSASAALVAYDRLEQTKIATAAAAASAKATTHAEGQAALAAGQAGLAAYLAKLATVNKAVVVVYTAIAIASTLNDEPSLAGARKALAQLVSAVVTLTGGAR